jgi:sulfate transport system ATP-binding protein
VGFEVRVNVLTDDGEDVVAVLTRTHARSLGLEPGAHVWVTPATGARAVPAMLSGSW